MGKLLPELFDRVLAEAAALALTEIHTARPGSERHADAKAAVNLYLGALIQRGIVRPTALRSEVQEHTPTPTGDNMPAHPRWVDSLHTWGDDNRVRTERELYEANKDKRGEVVLSSAELRGLLEAVGTLRADLRAAGWSDGRTDGLFHDRFCSCPDCGAF